MKSLGMYKRMLFSCALFGALSANLHSIKSEQEEAVDLLAIEDVVNILKNNTNLSHAETEKIIAQLVKQVGTDEYGRLNITGILTTTGFNYYLFEDRKHWDFVGHYKIEGNDRMFT